MSEEIKMLVELFGNVTDGAYTLLILYIAKSYLSIILGFGILFFAVAKAFALGKKALYDNSFFSKIKAVMGFHGELTLSEKEAIIKILKKGLSEN